MTKTVPYDGTKDAASRIGLMPALHELDPFGETYLSGNSPSEVAGRMDADLAAIRNETPKVVTSRIRVLLSRPLTWAEKEDLETDYQDMDLRRIRESEDNSLKLWVAPNHEHVWVEAEMGSRLAFEVVAASLAGLFVNVYPKAVRTFREYNG